MRKGNGHIFWTQAGVSLSLALFFSLGASSAANVPMPDLKDQFKKQDLKNPSQIQLEADQVSFSAGDNKAEAKGHVVVNSQDQHLYCDQLQLDRTIQQVVAQGNVYLDAPNENVIADGLTYNFDDYTGEFRNARVFLDPYQIRGKTIDKLSEEHITMQEGYLTTCDLDEPHFRMGARRMDVYTHDKAVVHGMKIFLGKVPVMYLPYYVQDLKNRPIITFVPGENKDFGLFLLATARLQVTPQVKLNLHLDTYERNGFGEGFDVKYNTPDFGRGLLSAYYINENQIAARHLWSEYKNGEKVGPTTHHERYRAIWRHRWQMDQSTDVVLQYYKIHDYDILNNGFLKTYFPREYRQDSQNTNLNTYLLLTRVLPLGTLTFNVDTSRVNRPIAGVNRLPEMKYVLDNKQIANSGFYVKSSNTLSNLSYQNYPKTNNYKAVRFDTNNDFSHPLKIGFIQFNPHLGGENTFYSATADPTRHNVFRGIFRGSIDMSTKFYRVWDVHTDFAGMNINGLRHVITPTITYLYQAKPTFPASRLFQYDPAIDGLYRIHDFQFGLENKLQTKRNGQVVDLLRFLVTTTYGLKGTTGHRGFNPYASVLDFNPNDWLTIHNENEYNFQLGHWNSENLDAVIHGRNWSLSLGNRYTYSEGDQVTTELDYVLNPKWKFKIYNSFPVVRAINGNQTSAKENEIVLTRDMHEWEMDLSLDRLEGHGTTFYVLFRLKAFPDLKLNVLSTSFQPSRPGSQNQTGGN